MDEIYLIFNRLKITTYFSSEEETKPMCEDHVGNTSNIEAVSSEAVDQSQEETFNLKDANQQLKFPIVDNSQDKLIEITSEGTCKNLPCHFQLTLVAPKIYRQRSVKTQFKL